MSLKKQSHWSDFLCLFIVNVRVVLGRVLIFETDYDTIPLYVD